MRNGERDNATRRHEPSWLRSLTVAFPLLLALLISVSSSVSISISIPCSFPSSFPLLACLAPLAMGPPPTEPHIVHFCLSLRLSLAITRLINLSTSSLHHPFTGLASSPRPRPSHHAQSRCSLDGLHPHVQPESADHMTRQKSGHPRSIRLDGLVSYESYAVMGELLMHTYIITEVRQVR